MMVLRRFLSLNGYPSKLLSDNGTQLIAASKELTAIKETWDWRKIKEHGVMEGLQWIFASADAPWQNGVTEALIRSVKRVIEFSVGENALTFSELQSVLFEIANLLNERPIGRHPTSPEDGTYLCPNDLLLGTDGKVRRVDVQYKNLTVSEPMKQYQGKGYVTVERPVQRLVLLIPTDEN
ncbi:hypothetical protein AWC38_SpisGene9564 [Stylophora pistillata]|uniref:Integrase catalytic domain-containing protein n=1 Tax=Stylophora pistillata TaxID=50429 RepID=A0A2B4SB55_STYPI|nr:hypothetical protein AWC38_SpisGene9564 [Stylophora pistillata]